MAGLVGGWLAYALTLLGGYLAVFGATLCLSCGLYYAAELAEEHGVLTGRLLGWSPRTPRRQRRSSVLLGAARCSISVTV